MQGRMDSHGLLAEHRLSDGTWSPSPFLELCSSLLSAVRTQAVCMCAEVTQKWEGIGSALAHAVRSGSAAGTVWAVWALSRVSVLLLLERRVDKGVLNDHFCPPQSIPFSRSSQETITIPISKWVCWVVPWRDDRSCIAYCIVSDFREMVLLYCYHLMYCVHICNAY